MLRVAEQLLTRDAWELCALEIATQTVAGHVFSPVLSEHRLR